MVTQSEILGTDIKLVDGDIQFDFNQDFKTISGKANLAQALKNRLNTGENELSYYINYGSKIINLLGEQNTLLTRNEARGYMFDAISNEPRVLQIIKTKAEFERDAIYLEIDVIAIDENNETNLVFNIE